MTARTERLELRIADLEPGDKLIELDGAPLPFQSSPRVIAARIAPVDDTPGAPREPQRRLPLRRVRRAPWPRDP